MHHMIWTFLGRFLLSNRFHFSPKYILISYGRPTIRIVRKLEKLNRTLVKKQGHVKFLQKCIRYKIVPKFLSFKLHKTLIQRCEKSQLFLESILLQKINEHQNEIRFKETMIVNLSAVLRQKISWLPWIRVKMFLRNCQQEEIEIARNTYKKKLFISNLDKHYFSGTSNAINNLTDYPLTLVETKALNKGLDFGILPFRFDFLQIQASFERLYHETRPYLSFVDRLEFKSLIFHLYDEYKWGYFHEKQKQQNLSKKEFRALKDLSKNSSLVICKPDKQNGVVLINRKDYVNTLENILKNRSKFEPVSTNNNLNQLKRFQDFLKRLCYDNVLDENTYRKIRPSSTLLPTLYGLPQLHEDNFSVCPILDSTGCYYHASAKLLSEILNPLGHHISALKDQFSFVEKVTSITLRNAIMASLHVKNLFINVPVNFTINNLILDNIFENEVKTFNGLNKTQLRKFLYWTTKGIEFRFNSELYKQTDGLFRGNPLASLMADIFMNWVVDQMNQFGPQPLVLFRYVDEIFCAFESEIDLNLFFQKISSIHHGIKFWKEVEWHNQLRYLNVLITRLNNGSLQTNFVRKTANAELDVKWSSLCPIKIKLEYVSDLLERIYRTCNSYTTRHVEFRFFRKMLLRNGYPLKNLKNRIRGFLKKKQRIRTARVGDSKHVPSTTLKLPFIGNYSTRLEMKLKSFFQRCLTDKLDLNVDHTYCRIGDMFKLREKQPKLFRTCVVYRLTCSCGSTYIGQTKRNLQTRLNEHKPKTSAKPSSDVTQHLLKNPSHSIDFDNPEILCAAYNLKELLIKETLLIQRHQPVINAASSSYPLHVFNT